MSDFGFKERNMISEFFKFMLTNSLVDLKEDTLN